MDGTKSEFQKKIAKFSAELKKRYDIPYGLSDHTLSGATSISAVTLGAQVIEKHFTISKWYRSCKDDDSKQIKFSTTTHRYIY
mgnify:CR=1 FL=1